jgi:hypothetical protein
LWVTTEGLGMMRYLYLKCRGKEPTDAELTEGAEKLKEQLKDNVDTAGNDDLGKYLDGKYSTERAKEFNELLRTGETDSKYPDVKFREVADDSMYVMSGSKLDLTKSSPTEAAQSMIDTAIKNAEGFLKSKYPQIGENLFRYINLEEMRGVRVVSDNSYRLFIRVPVPGSKEFSDKTLQIKREDAEKKEKPHEDIFGPADKLEYGKLESWEQETLRIRFLLDAGQTAEIDKICEWFTDKFKGENLSRTEVMSKMFGDEKLMEEAVTETGVKQDLKGNFDFYHKKDAELSEMEANEAKAFDTTWSDKINPFGKLSDAYEPLIKHMKREMGYRVRLAILGDKQARQYFIGLDAEKYDPDKNDAWIEDLTKDYKQRCSQLVSDYGTGKLKF